MADIEKTSVKDHLALATNAKMLGHLDMGAECAASIWSNDKDRVSYQQTEGHTFSFYLAGGRGSSRLDLNSAPKGWQGAVCVMPQGHTSQWQVSERIEFLHLYLSDKELRRLFARTFDKDARLLDVRELTFTKAEQLFDPFYQIQRAVYDNDPMLAEQATLSLFHECMTSNLLGELQQPRLTGGLSPQNLRRVKEYMFENLNQNIRLQDLADLTGLSEFHFQRNFSAQCGVSPHSWLTYIRIEHAKSLMSQNQKMAEIAVACGFSSQSHFSRTFKKLTGVTPGFYLQKTKDS